MNDLAKQWLQKAESDLLCAENNLNSEQIPVDTVCYHCAQAVEKYLKAFLVIREIQFPWIHNLLRLLELYKKADESFEQLREQLLILNTFSGEIRYPDEWFEPTIEEAKEALKTAKNIKKFISEKIEVE